jgi:tRNA (guanine-N7-)-methyltransferase
LSERPERARRLLYGRRKGPKLSPHQQNLRDTLLPTLALHLEQDRDPITYFSPPPTGEVDARSVASTSGGGDFSAPHLSPTRNSQERISTSPVGGGEIKDVWLEVGYGSGEHLLWQARANPAIGIIGAEPYISGTAKLLSKLEQEPATNIRLYEDDARDIIEALPAHSIGRFFILFPDPWHKTRHHKRRFIQSDMLDQLARILKPGAELRFASDDAGYLAYALERLMAHPAFAWTATGPSDWRSRTADWPKTRYEAKELHGSPAFLRFVRTDKIAP